MIEAQGSVLRELHSLLEDNDPGYCGLVRVQNKRRQFLWVHPDYVGVSISPSAIHIHDTI